MSMNKKIGCKSLLVLVLKSFAGFGIQVVSFSKKSIYNKKQINLRFETVNIKVIIV